MATITSKLGEPPAKQLSRDRATPARVARLYGLSHEEADVLLPVGQAEPAAEKLAELFFKFAEGLDRDDTTSSWLKWLSTRNPERNQPTPREILIDEGIDRFGDEVLKAATKHRPQWFVERLPKGEYAVRRAGAKRASAIERTQSRAIERAREIAPTAAVHVERAGHNGFDKWR